MTKSALVQGNLMSTSSYQTALYNLNWICVIITKLKSSEMWLSRYTDNFLFLAKKKKLDLQTYTFGFWFCVLVWYTFYHSPNPPKHNNTDSILSSRSSVVSNSSQMPTWTSLWLLFSQKCQLEANEQKQNLSLLRSLSGQLILMAHFCFVRRMPNPAINR